MPKKVVHVISHSHWDREWYMPFENHRVRLIELMDTLIELIEKDPEYDSFHLDGQTIVLEDYLQIRPEMKFKLQELVKEKRLHIGPWYILQDEFLTSGEANVRNLLAGRRDAAEFGLCCEIGYFPDSFGNMGQAPQLLKQAGMHATVFGRGVKPIGPDNFVVENDQESIYSELVWRSPDGSEVLGIFLANWYHNGIEIPTDPEQTEAYWTPRLQAAERYASTPHLLFMNGCDHQPVQTDVTKALEVARERYPEVDFVHSNFTDYVKRVQSSLPTNRSVVQGELRSRNTDGWTTLVNTASSRVYLKQANQLGQTLLEKVAEPLAAWASLHGQAYPHHLFQYAWRTLMQNHPHDSICGCSVDEVHREMMTRFMKSRQVAEEIIDLSLRTIVSSIDTNEAFGGCGDREDTKPFAIFNTTGWKRTGVVSVELEVKQIELQAKERGEIIEELKAIDLRDSGVIDAKGNAIAAEMEDLGVTFGYKLPKDKFRQSYMARKVRVTFQAQEVPALGYKSYAWKRVHSSPVLSKLAGYADDRILENEFLKVNILDDGTFNLLDKRNSRQYNGLGAFENAGDIGNEYIFLQASEEQALTTRGMPARIALKEHTAFRKIYEIVHEWSIPSGADERLTREFREFVPLRERTAKRSAAHTPLILTTLVTLERGVPYLKLKTSLYNQAKNHRIRVLFPTDTDSSIHRADSVFEVAERETKPAPEWTNPSHCQHQQAFVNVSDRQGGLTVGNRGLNEYEIMRDGRNTIALTLLRAVGEMGDWGPFATPEAQCPGRHEFEYTLIPHTGDSDRTATFISAYQEQVPWSWKEAPLQNGKEPAEHQWLRWDGEEIALSAVKVRDDSSDLSLRWYNLTRQARRLAIDPIPGARGYYKSSVVEEHKGNLNVGAPIEIGPAEIYTIGVSL